MARVARIALGVPNRLLRCAILARTALVTLLVLVASVYASAQTSCPDPAPAFTLLTYDEDNRHFSNPYCRTKFLDRLKFIPLRGDNEDYYLSFGIFTRDRGEYFNIQELASPAHGNAYLMQRYLLHMDLHLGDRFRFFGELASSIETATTAGPPPPPHQEPFYVHHPFFFPRPFR